VLSGGARGCRSRASFLLSGVSKGSPTN
jgi:hypothetical protein